MMLAPGAIAGTTGLPRPEPPFVAVDGRSSRIVDSFYLGDGAALLNQTAAAVNPQLDPVLSGVRISPLDPALAAWHLTRSSRTHFGIGIGHSITQYALVEVGFEQGSSRTALSRDALATIEDARSSYVTSVQPLLTRPFTSDIDVQSTASVHDHDRTNQMLTVAASFNGGTFRGITPYMTVGAGYVRPRGDAPGFSMSGSYSFALPPPPGQTNLVLATGSEGVSVAYEIEPSIVRVLGVGVRVHVNSWSGVRLDVRRLDAQEGGRLSIDVKTHSELGADSGPPFRFTTGANPVVQFSIAPSVPSSLRLEPNSFSSFESTKRWSATLITVGYFLRF